MQTQPRHEHARVGDITHDQPVVQAAPGSWQQFGWDQLTLDELIALQRSLRPIIEAKRKRSGELRQQEAGLVRERKLPEHLHGTDVY